MKLKQIILPIIVGLLVAGGVYAALIYPFQGGTGLGSYSSGDILIATSTDTLYALSKGSDGQVLKLSSGKPAWGTDDTGAGGSAITYDIGDDGGNDSVDVSEIATTGDTNTIFTEPSADKILIAVGNNWPTADLATTATTANAGDAAVDFFGAGIDAVTDATTCTNIEGTNLSITGGTLNAVDTNTQLSAEEVQDHAFLNTLGGTETHIAVTYQDGTNDIDFVVSDDWYNSVADFSTTLTDTNWCRYNLAGTEINCDVTPFSDTNTNANTICAGGTTYLDGEGNCDDISGVYVDTAGDTMTGRLTVTETSAGALTTQVRYLNSSNTAGTGGRLSFRMLDSNSAVKTYGRVATEIDVNTAGSEDGTMRLSVIGGGVFDDILIIDGSSKSTTFAGAIIGDVTGNCSGSSGTCTGNAATASSASDVSCAECLIIVTEVKAGTLTNAKYCTWDTANTQIVCNSEGGAGATAWDDIGNPDAADEIDFGAYITELNVADFRIGDGGANYVGFNGTPLLSFNGNADINLPNDSVDAADINTIN